MATTDSPELVELRDQAKALHRGLQEALEAALQTSAEEAEKLEAAAYLAENVERALHLLLIRRWRESEIAPVQRDVE